MLQFVKKLLGTTNDRRVKSLMQRVQKKINPLEAKFAALSDDELRAMTPAFRERLAKGASLDDILDEAFAVVREAAKRTLGQRHYDVQLVGGMVLNTGAIAEMRTGEGKTLVATAPVYLNALTGKGVHVVTVNDYLATRDAEWMGQVYRFLGMSVGTIVHGLTDEQRRASYACDITYGTNNEFGFDYLRDNMKYALEEMVQKPHYFAIVDEVDSILIDEARTPLIISGPTDDRSEFYKQIDAIIPLMEADDYELDEKQRQVTFSEKGSERLEEILTERGMIEGSLWDTHNITVVHHAQQALRAHKLYTLDKDYIVNKDNEVVLIDEFTGRMMFGRRLSDGLHQAIEAKEGANIQPENQTLASITFQNYFRLYEKLGGMTGTASTEAAEFESIYKLAVVEIPTNKPVRRIDEQDVVYRTAKEKYKAILNDIEACWERRQPVLVGTVSIEKSELLAEMMKERGFRQVDVEDKTDLSRFYARAGGDEKVFTVLNARYHEAEAHIVANAGIPGAITIATNMAGRGTDIQLGGNLEMRLEDEIQSRTSAGNPPSEDEIAALRAGIAADVAAKKEAAMASGGLYVLGTERHESRRIDNQLRGRTGRQGDPGLSKFYICLEDDLLRIFAADRLDKMMAMLKIEEDEAITHPWMSKAMEISQKRVEQRNFEIRKNLLKYDDVINDQRKAAFSQRIEFMKADSVADTVKEMRQQVVEDCINRRLPLKALPEQWDLAGLREDLAGTLGLDLPVEEWAKEEGIANEEIAERVELAAEEHYARTEEALSPERTRWLEKQVLLQMIDNRWREHLAQIDQLRSVIHLRGYGQRDPLNEYKAEAFVLFQDLLADLRTTVTRTLMRVQISYEPAPPIDASATSPLLFETKPSPDTDLDEMGDAGGDDLVPSPLGPMPRAWLRTPRNAPCPCGSGKKFKHCHGAISQAA